MDRRTFLTGIGTLGATTAGGWTALESSARGSRAEGLARAAGAPKAGAPGRGPVAPGGARPLQQGLTLGYLNGSAGLLALVDRGRAWNLAANPLRWTAWTSSLSRPAFDSRAHVSIGMLQSLPVSGGFEVLRSLQVVAHFALDESPHFAPFDAWQYRAAAPGRLAAKTSPLTFEAAMPDRVGLQVSYAHDKARLVPGIADTGMVYLPLGGIDGPGTGIYVLAGPSRLSGAMPDLSRFVYSGDIVAPLLGESGTMPDFDYVTLTIAPIPA